PNATRSECSAAGECLCLNADNRLLAIPSRTSTSRFSYVATDGRECCAAAKSCSTAIDWANELLPSNERIYTRPRFRLVAAQTCPGWRRGLRFDAGSRPAATAREKTCRSLAPECTARKPRSQARTSQSEDSRFSAGDGCAACTVKGREAPPSS